MQMAISVYKSKKISSQSKAAEVFGVPRNIFQDRLRGINSRSETRANSHKLTISEKKALVQKLLDTDKRGFPIRPEFLRGMAQILLREQL